VKKNKKNKRGSGARSVTPAAVAVALPSYGAAAVTVPFFGGSLVASKSPAPLPENTRAVTFNRHVKTFRFRIPEGCRLRKYRAKPQSAIALQRSGKFIEPVVDTKISRKHARLAVLRALRLRDLIQKTSGQSLSAKGDLGEQEWILDSGSCFDIVGTQSLSNVERGRIRKDGAGVLTQTANGAASETRKLDINVDRLDRSVEAVVRDRCPHVLSLGHRCLIDGYSFHWKNY